MIDHEQYMHILSQLDQHRRRLCELEKTPLHYSKLRLIVEKMLTEEGTPVNTEDVQQGWRWAARYVLMAMDGIDKNQPTQNEIDNALPISTKPHNATECNTK